MFRGHFPCPCANRSENADEIDNFLERNNLPKIGPSKEFLREQLSQTKIKGFKFSPIKALSLDGFTGKFYPTFKEWITSVLLILEERIF